MSKLTLITVQGKLGAKDSVADILGLTDDLGYRPFFCTLVDPNSLTETWFRLLTASPRYPETIHLFQIDEADCIPMNVLDWTNKCISSNFTSKTLQSIKNNHYSLATDYLVKEIPEDAISIDVKALLYSTEIYDYALGSTPKEKEEMCNMFKMVQNSCIKKAEHLKSLNPKTSDNNILYEVLRSSGIISFLWQIATGNSVTVTLYTIEPGDFTYASFKNAQELLKKWDERIDSGENFFTEEYELMRQEFLTALNIAAKSAIEREARRNGIYRNDLCTCGSGKKFKHCHALKKMDELTTKTVIVD